MYKVLYSTTFSTNYAKEPIYYLTEKVLITEIKSRLVSLFTTDGSLDGKQLQELQVIELKRNNNYSYSFSRNSLDG